MKLEPISLAHAAYRVIGDKAVAARPWLVTNKRSISYGELKIRIGQVAALLKQRQIGQGERVVIAGQDDAEIAQLFIALVCCGVTVVNLDPDTGPERAQALITKTAPALMLVDRDLLARWSLPLTEHVLEMVPGAEGGKLLGRLLGKAAPREGLHGILAALEPVEPPEQISEETLAYILFTSGTTSQPKGVSISHRALFSHLATLSRRYGYEPGSRILNTLMLSHADGMIQGPVIAFFNQATVLRPLKFEVTTIEPLLDAIYQLRITHMIAVPTMLALILRLGLDQVDAFQGGDFRLLVSCGAQLEKALWESFESTFRVPLINVYGLTETVVGGVFSGPAGESHQPGSIGLPEDCELRLIDAQGDTVAEGELLMRGRLLMSGYFGEPGMTAEVLREGWFHTGDIARRDEAGRYWIMGRAKNIIIRGGYNIHPEEITEVLQRHPGVREAVTLGMADAVWGETVAALVAAGEGASTDELLAFCALHMEPRKVPTRLLVVPALPRGRSGKVLLEEARALLQQGGGCQATLTVSSADVEQRILRVAAKCLNANLATLSLASTPQDIPGWDSLAHMELVCALEQEFGVQLSARDIMALDRLDKVLGLVGA